MPRTRIPYPAAFREQVVALHRAGRSIEQLATVFEPCAATIHSWVKQAERDAGGRADILSSAEREELRRLGVPPASRTQGELPAQAGA